MSHYKPYPTYKDSGVEWLGRVPEHWSVRKVKWEATARSGTDNKSETGSFPLYGANGVIGLTDTPSLNAACVLIGRVGSAGSVTFVSEKCGVSDNALLYFNNTYDAPRFDYYLLQSMNLEADVSKNAQPLITASDIRDRTICVPRDLLERRSIASSLDRETTRLDALIEKKTRFIELLREKRQALITHAVTRGLDPSVKMKGSGVEWLGAVPEHWKLVPLKYVTPSLTVGIVVNPSDYVADEGLPFLYGGDIGEGVIFAETARRISPEHSQRNAKTRLNAGDLVTVRVGAPGVTAVVPPECEGGNCASVMLIRRGAFNSDWLCYTMNSRVVRYQVEVVQYGAAQEQFNISHAVDFLIPVPPLEEQAAIASALNQEGRRVDALLSKTERSIALLKERRSTLITAAVTGQIDLREAV